MDEILEYILGVDERIVKYGQVDEKILMELRMTTSLYEHIQTINNYYDDEDMPYFNNWTDIEGFGYGWCWMNHDEKNWHKMMSQLVDGEALYLKRVMDDALYFVYEDEKVKTYHFIVLEDKERYDVIISFSNDDLF